MQENNNFRWSACPLCGSVEIYCCGKINYRKPIMFSTDIIELKITPELYKCQKCRSWFTQNIISKESALMLYSKGDSCDKWPRKVGFEKEKSRKIIERIDQYFIAGKNVLDVGANTGVLLDYARKKGCVTSGVEPSMASQKVLKNKKHYIYSTIDDVDRKFDVITAFDLVEHLYNLNEFLESVYELLANGGVLILLTGDVNSISAKLSGKNWWYIKAPEHIVFPSVQYLNTLKKFKFVSVDKTYASKGYDRSILYAIAQYMRKKLFSDDYDGLPSFGPDHVLVIYKK